MAVRVDENGNYEIVIPEGFSGTVADLCQLIAAAKTER